MNATRQPSPLGRRGCAWLLVGSLLSAGCAGPTPAAARGTTIATNRPERYADSWGQFFVDTYTNPRQVAILRLGAGDARPAEYWIFEWADGGQRLRPLHQSVLRNSWVPWSWRAAGDGRFLVTFDDRFEPQGVTDNCIVLYDFVRGRTVARRADDFLPEKWLGSASGRAKWDGGPAYVDPLLHVIYVTTPARARQGSNPFVVIDLPSLSVQVRPVPESLPERVYCETRDGHAWEWQFSMGTAAEPDWLTPFALPAFLLGRRVQPLVDEDVFGTRDEVAYLRFDASDGTYVRCPAEQWRDPPTIWTAEAK